MSYGTMRKFVRVWALAGRHYEIKYFHDFEVIDDDYETAYREARNFVRARRHYLLNYEEITE